MIMNILHEEKMRTTFYLALFSMAMSIIFIVLANATGDYRFGVGFLFTVLCFVWFVVFVVWCIVFGALYENWDGGKDE